MSCNAETFYDKRSQIYFGVTKFQKDVENIENITKMYFLSWNSNSFL